MPMVPGKAEYALVNLERAGWSRSIAATSLSTRAMAHVHYRCRWWVMFGALNKRPLTVAKPGSARTAPDGRLKPFVGL